MWGPPDAVQYAVRANAERMGFPAPDAYIPFWESAGEVSREVMRGGIGTLVGTGAYLSNMGLRVPEGSTGRMGFSDNYIAPCNLLKFTLIGRVSGVWYWLSQLGSALQGVVSWSRFRLSGNNWNVGGITTNETHDWIVSFNSPNITSFTDGQFRNTGTESANSSTNTLYFGSRNDGGLPLGGTIFQYILWHNWTINEAQAGYYHHQPYALLMPVARPVFFDLGIGSVLEKKKTITSNLPSYRPDIKPPMWGPPDAVQYAVRANAERMSAPAPLIALCHWEGTGSTLYNHAYPCPDQSITRQWPTFSMRSLGWSQGAINADGSDYVDLADNQLFMLNYMPGASIIASGHYTITSARNYILHLTTSGTFTLVRMELDTNRKLSVGARSAFDAQRTSVSSQTFETGRHTFGAVINIAAENIALFADGQFLQRDAGSYANSTFIVAEGHAGPQKYLSDGNEGNRAVGRPDLLVIFPSAISDAVMEFSTACPYALFMPVTRPIYFDQGKSPISPPTPTNIAGDKNIPVVTWTWEPGSHNA